MLLPTDMTGSSTDRYEIQYLRYPVTSLVDFARFVRTWSPKTFETPQSIHYTAQEAVHVAADLLGKLSDSREIGKRGGGGGSGPL
jgi:hypothetical protein